MLDVSAQVLLCISEVIFLFYLRFFYSLFKYVSQTNQTVTGLCLCEYMTVHHDSALLSTLKPASFGEGGRLQSGEVGRAKLLPTLLVTLRGLRFLP